MQDPTELTISGHIDNERMIREPSRECERCQPNGARQDEEEGKLVAYCDPHYGGIRAELAELGIRRQEE